ncbi:MAG: corrinoid protein [Desulfobacteraceae bacterium]|jgi:5-methyltetrahydrofolate--homocysteine methyltransferase|nr:corrinoid protein [Desulfobacteraceae bacterium]
MIDYNAITETLMKGDAERLTVLVREALEGGAKAGEVLNTALIPGMDVVGQKMETGDLFIPEVLMSAQAMSAAVEILKPLLGEGEAATPGKVVIGTVKGDLHDIGKNLVTMMIESAGFEVVDLGVDVSPQQFVEAIKTHQPDVVGLSALLTTTMNMMQQTIAAIVAGGCRERVKIIVGGAPVTERFAAEIGADGYAADAGAASKLVKSFFN